MCFLFSFCLGGTFHCSCQTQFSVCIDINIVFLFTAIIKLISRASQPIRELTVAHMCAIETKFSFMLKFLLFLAVDLQNHQKWEPLASFLFFLSFFFFFFFSFFLLSHPTLRRGSITEFKRGLAYFYDFVWKLFVNKYWSSPLPKSQEFYV